MLTALYLICIRFTHSHCLPKTAYICNDAREVMVQTASISQCMSTQDSARLLSSRFPCADFPVPPPIQVQVRQHRNDNERLGAEAATAQAEALEARKDAEAAMAARDAAATAVEGLEGAAG